MRRNLLLCVLALVLVLVLAGCGCNHEWTAANCENPKTCNLCGKTSGVALGHIWQEATCTAPKTCSVCQATEGKPNEHTWSEANCQTPKTCSVCQATEGELGGHIWIDADCTKPRTCSLCDFKDDTVMEHTWQEATCTAPKTCSVCKKTEGEALPHTWEEATCTAPKTCSVCKATEGEALPHTWEEATCKAPKTCSVCKKTEGGIGDHKWEEATTQAPKTCSVCKQTSGSKLDTDPRFNTASTKVLQGVWICDVFVSDAMLGLEDFGGVQGRLTLTFGNTGNMTMIASLKDEAGDVQRYRTYAIERLYAQYAREDGLDRDQADQAMIADRGMTVPGYVDSVLKSHNVDDMLADYNRYLVYYVEGNTAYTAGSWDASFSANTFTVSGGTLVVNGISLEEGGPTLVWTRA